jgi:hypothetical protein
VAEGEDDELSGERERERERERRKNNGGVLRRIGEMSYAALSSRKLS